MAELLVDEFNTTIAEDYIMENMLVDMNKISDISGLEKVMKHDIKKAINRGMDMAVTKVETSVIRSMADYGVSELIGAIRVTPYLDGWEVVIDDPQADFVEYGTGVKGSKSPHPNAPERGWRYDIYGHGEKGWIAPRDQFDPDPDKIPLSNGSGKWFWTKGKAAKPFFHKAIYNIRRSGAISRAIRAELRKLK